jgi:serine/threonine-protein kinase
MADEPRVQQLLDEILDSERTPEEVCGACPDLLPEVRRRWQQMRVLEAELQAMFPTPGPDPGAGAPASRCPGADLPRVPGYEVEAVLGRGGMGVVYKARHLRLNRPVALKMLLVGAYAGAHELARFLREAEAVAGLRHANIVQVHDVGDFAGMPYFTMEFVEGGSLAQKLAGTPQPARQAAALLATLAGAVQAAHQGGIVHRDLKPANVLLTADGTPKISDFGLARRLDAEAGHTLTGTLVGTPSYMAPEQAQGKTDAVGPATDIYALGAILYELLTGRPPFRAATAAETIRQVISQDPVPPSRLNKVPRDLETVCLQCLHKQPERRYSSARELADDLGRFGRGEPVAARPVGVAERAWKWVRRRPTAAGLLAAVVLLVAAGGVGAWLLSQQRATARGRQAQTDQEVRGILARARGLLEEGWQAADLAKLTEAKAEGNRAEGIARKGGATAAARQEAETFREDAVARLGRAEKNRALLEAVLDVSAPQETLASIRDEAGRMLVLAQPSMDEQYAAAFRRWGLDVDGAAEAEVVARLGAEPGVVVQELIAALDGWMLARRQLKRPEAQWRRLFRVADRLDRSERHRQLRALLVGGSPPHAEGGAGLVGVGSPWPALWELARGNTWRQLREVQKDIDPRKEPALTVVLLAQACAAVGDTAGAEKLLRRAATARQDQVVLLAALGKLLERQGPSRLEEAIGYYRAARGQRRHLGIALSKALLGAGKAEEAEEVLQELVLRQADDLNPAFYFYLGTARMGQQRYGAAEAAYRQAIDLEPDLAEAYSNLGAASNAQQKYGRAEAACRQAIGLNPGLSEAYYHLGNALSAQGKHREAEPAFQKAIDLKPHYAAYYNLGNARMGQERYGAAEAAFRKAIDLRPDYAEAYTNLGSALVYQGKHGESEAALRKAIGLNPGLSEAYYNLGTALSAQGKHREAAPAFQKAIDLKPDFGLAYHNLGIALMQQAQFDEAAASLKKAGELSPAKDPLRAQARQLLQQCRRYVSLDARLPAILLGKEKPANAVEQIELARLCILKEHHAAAARFSRDAFTAEPILAEVMPGNTRYHAARAAALAGCGEGKDADKLDDKERALWRRQALDWLRQDLTWWGKVLDNSDAQTNARVGLWVRHWQTDASLAGVRAKGALARLPDEEGKQWQGFWSDVDALLRRVSQAR